MVVAYYVRVLADVRHARVSLITDSLARLERQRAWMRVARISWTLGVVLLITHLVLAFALIHDWSQAAAIRHTELQTQNVVGLRVGFGVCVNYAFTRFWTVDVLLWWTQGASWAYRSRWRYWVIQFVFAFIMINATVVFGPWWWKPVSLAAIMGLGLARRLALPR